MDDVNVIEYKNKVIIGILVDELGMTFIDASKLWYNSKTRHRMLKNGMLEWLGAATCVEELDLELKNSPMWMKGQFIG